MYNNYYIHDEKVNEKFAPVYKIGSSEKRCM